MISNFDLIGVGGARKMTGDFVDCIREIAAPGLPVGVVIQGSGKINPSAIVCSLCG